MAHIPVEEVKGARRPSRLKPVAAGVAVLAALALGLFAVTRPAVEPVAPAPPPAETAPPGLLPSPADGGAGFAVEVGGLVIPYDTFAVTALPGDTLALRARYLGGEVQAEATDGVLARTGPRAWTWTAPTTPGVSRVAISGPGGEAMVLQALTLVPFDHSTDAIGAYAIGDYEDEPMNGDPAYDEPPGFVQVTPDLVDLPVSPHFRLGQFLAKQASGWPKYIVLSGPLLLKLERTVGAVRAAGVPADGLTVMSGFRTPAYNAAIGNTTVYSRHLYGDAADVFVDEDGDGVMDDLDGDGAVTRADAEWLAAVVEGLTDEPGYDGLVGGLGIYDANAVRGPFVHVDTRGTAVRW